MKKLNFKKVILTIISLFVIWNIIWFSATTIRYHKFVKVIPQDENGLHGMVGDDGYTYYVKKPDYLHFTGNLAISNSDKGQDLIIWPHIIGGYEYGFRLRKNEDVYEIYVDKNLEPVNKDHPVDVQLVKEFNKDLQELYEKADNMWGLSK